MELKHIIEEFEKILLRVLIVPYGIETSNSCIIPFVNSV
ncbi:hypothetical protein HMPREF1203_00724, partial [Bacteroides fragilis HMW 610]